MLKKAQPYFIGTLFIVAGVLHFVKPQTYEAIMPPYVPNPKALVAISGAFEILGGLGVMPKQTRAAAGWGLIALLLAVFPANLYMATDHEKFASIAPAWLWYGRLPLQALLMYWVYASCVVAE